jgi:hypothetical protein
MKKVFIDALQRTLYFEHNLELSYKIHEYFKLSFRTRCNVYQAKIEMIL